MNTNDWGDVIAHQAQQWDGKDFRAGVKEQCMNWIRIVLEQVHHPYAARVTEKAVDGHWTGASLASSLAGRDLGEMITSTQSLEPGDICFWNDTYDTGFPPQTISHVGIALGPTSFIHRNTMAAPVNTRSFSESFWASHFRCALRVPQQIKPEPAVKAPIESATGKLYLNGGASALVLRQYLDPGSYTLWSSGSTDDGSWLAKFVRQDKPPSSGANRLWLGGNGSTLDVREPLNPTTYSLLSAGSEGGAWLLKLVPR